MPPKVVSFLPVTIENADTTVKTKERFHERVFDILKRVRSIEAKNVRDNAESATPIDASEHPLDILMSIAFGLSSTHRTLEAEAISRTFADCTESKDQGGLGMAKPDLEKPEKATPAEIEAILTRTEAWFESLNSAERSRRLPQPLSNRPQKRRGMTLSQKIFAHHVIGYKGHDYGLKVGDVVRVSVDWVIASEISWVGMKKTLDEFGDYKVWRNDRFWLAGDHVVDPRNYETDLSKKLLAASNKAAKDFKLTDYRGPNYTIIHTEFVRSRAEPGMLAIGSDSHTCSSGAVGCLAIGLGAADVAMPLVTGETWFKIPESISVKFVGQPGPGIGGKDTILYILGELKRNTVAAERIVEFSGPGIKHLSIDARFAISNMCTEFGAITGVFVPDEVTEAYIKRRKQKNRKASSIYFKPDDDAEYAGTYEIDLSKVRSSFAVYPNPDDVVPVSEKEGMALDGCFIGACTTALEDLILGAMVLQAGMKKGLTKKEPAQRHVVPGSLPVKAKLEELGLLQAYTDAGFRIGAPGCSFCVGMGSDQAKPGEVWLSSQNRNFQNRMGKGSFGNLSSAATVAASSFSMTVTDPTELLSDIDMDQFDKYRGHSRTLTETPRSKRIHYVEPNIEVDSKSVNKGAAAAAERNLPKPKRSTVESKIVRLGDYIDTDALAPAEFLVTVDSDEELGSHCLQYTYPEFRDKVKNGQKVVVAGKAFGVGSSREEAVRALLGAGIQAVIARSFAFIYGRNQPNLGLLGITISDDAFYDAATEGAEIKIDINTRTAQVGGKTFEFPLTDIEISLLANEGMSKAYKRFGNSVFRKLTGAVDDDGSQKLDKAKDQAEEELPDMVRQLQW